MLTMPILAIASIWDIRTHKIPNKLILLGLAVGLTSAAFSGWHGLGWSLAGIMVRMVSMLPLYNWRLMGGGDVKLAGVRGVVTGFPGILIAIPLALVFGGITMAILQSSGTTKTGDRIPFGPMLSFAGVVAYFFADWIFLAYLGIIVG